MNIAEMQDYSQRNGQPVKGQMKGAFCFLKTHYLTARVHTCHILPLEEKPPNIDVVSLQKPLREIYDDKVLEGADSMVQHEPLIGSSQRNFASIVQEYSPLASYVNSSVNLNGITQEFFSNPAEYPIKWSANSTESYMAPDLRRLIRRCGGRLKTNPSFRGKELSDVSIWYSLLEIFVFNRRPWNRGTDSDEMNRAVKACTGPYLTLCEHGIFEVTEASSHKFYKISIENVIGDAEWTIIRSWDDFRELNKQLSIFLPGAELWQPGSALDRQSNWINYLSDETIPNPRVMGPLLGFALRSTFLQHGSKLLDLAMSSGIIAFLRPTGSLDGVTLRNEGFSVYRMAMYGEPLRIINLGAFIPPKLFAVMMVNRVAEYETPASTYLINHGQSRFSLLLRSKLDPESAQSFDLYTVKDVAASESLTALDSPPVPMLLSFSIGSASNLHESEFESMSFLFSDWMDFILWHEVLKLFSRLGPYPDGP
ncbi:hypothetical protein ONS95_006734 [Cadophora gregata]|uniref:uncharacterized protein n=1 Tax=Cadophora gregata TaxID=51156 RepID=UPI0026DCE4F1|nr:uncharacterized protein ONS95_006734 [Cadophora gregata]KAK0101570.1 hypothetical protein ONS95_006734 [Cadophora gregata]KAK0106417.1 hypothetical protein ONS96_004048 [Cadophora gregata f. sp. sojae]